MTEQKVDIAQQIEKLIGLQSVDSVIYKLRAEKEQKPRYIQQLNQQMEQELKAVEEGKNSIKALQVKRKEKEIELETKETNIKKLSVQLYQLKTNKEYNAMQLEIGGLKADCSVLEEDTLKLMDEIEKEESMLMNAQKEIDKRKQQIASQIKIIEDEIKSVENQLAQEEARRQELSSEIDATILSNYDRILKGKDGLAVIAVIDHACGGCFMQLPPQVINEIRLKHEIIYCQMCSRILYDKGT